jgi:phosphate transport system substrate-binding protein
MHKKASNVAAAKEAIKFFDWAYANGGKMAESLDYVPLPENVVAQIKKNWVEIVGQDNKPIFATN